MKPDTEIKTDVYKVIKGSALEAAVSGELRKTKRPFNSDKEDIVISVLDNGSGQIQEAFVNVNIYVPDIERGNQYEEDSLRCDELSKIAVNVLGRYNGGSFRFVLDKQRLLEVNGKNEHCINNRLLYKQSNE